MAWRIGGLLSVLTAQWLRADMLVPRGQPSPSGPHGGPPLTSSSRTVRVKLPC